MNMQLYKTEKNNKISIYTIVNGKKKQVKTYELNEKRKANRFILTATADTPEVKQALLNADETKAMVELQQFKNYIQKDRLNIKKTNKNYLGFIDNFIEPYFVNQGIEKISDLSLGTFKETFIPMITKAKNCKGDLLSKKSVIEIVGLFKRFVRYCDEKNINCDLRILTFKFSRNALQRFPGDQFVPFKDQVSAMIKLTHNLPYKALLYTAAETGARPNEILGLTWENIDFKNKKIFIRDSIDYKNRLRKDFLKNSGSRRVIDCSDKLLALLDTAFIYKKGGRVFNYSLKVSKRIVQDAAKRAGVNWVGGLKPFRKFSSTLIRNSKMYSDKGFTTRFGWGNLNTFNKHYEGNLDNQKENQKLLNNLNLTE